MKNMRYLGHLQINDPLYGYLRYDILPLLNGDAHSPHFRVYQLPASHPVYLYEDQRSHARIIGKFFGGVPGLSPETASHHMEREFHNLHYLRSIGFTSYPHYVVRPLGRNASLDNILVEEFCYGTPFSDFIVKAIHKGARDALFQKLTALAYFLASLHNRTASDSTVDFDKDCKYFDRILRQLTDAGRMEWEEAQMLYQLKDQWRAKGCMWEDCQVLVHSDVTPPNILFGDELWVIVIDLERLRPADRVFDLGRVVGELQHFFMQQAGDKWLAEPFIGHFLWEYACHFPDRDTAFAAIIRRIPFYSGLNLLRIARNSWINTRYSHQLVHEARKSLGHAQ